MPAGDQLVVVWAADLHLPKLLRSALLDRDGNDMQAPRPVWAQEVGDVRDPDSLLAAVLDRLVSTGGRKGLDHGGVEPAVNESPGLVVALVGGD